MNHNEKNLSGSLFLYVLRKTVLDQSNPFNREFEEKLWHVPHKLCAGKL